MGRREHMGRNVLRCRGFQIGMVSGRTQRAGLVLAALGAALLGQVIPLALARLAALRGGVGHRRGPGKRRHAERGEREAGSLCSPGEHSDLKPATP